MLILGAFLAAGTSSFITREVDAMSEALKESAEGRFRSLFESASEFIHIVDTNGTIPLT